MQCSEGSFFIKGLYKIRHQDGMSHARGLLEEKPFRGNEKGSQRRFRELSDHDAGLTPVKEKGKDGELCRKHLRLQCISKEVQWGCWEIPEKVFQLRSPFFPRNSPDLIFLPYLIRLEAAHGKCGFHINTVVGSECNNWDHQLIMPSATGALRGSFHGYHGHQYFITFRREHLIL